MKKSIIAILLVLIFALAGCSSDGEFIANNKGEVTDTSSRDDRVTIYTYVDPEDENQHFDNDTMFYLPILQMAHMFNNYCSMNGVGNRSVEVIKFSSRDRMIQQMSTEIMAGGGPDIILLDNELPISKLVNQGAFVDINTFIEDDTSENKLDLDNYNKELMNTGVFNGRRYIMPMLYRPDILISNTKVMEHYKIKSNTQLTYSNLLTELEEYTGKEQNVTFLEGYESSKDILLQYINDNIDKEKNTTTFNTNEFKTNVLNIKKLILKGMKGEKTANSIEENSCIFSKGTFDDGGVYTPTNYCLPSIKEVANDSFSIFDNLPEDKLNSYAQAFYSKIDPDEDILWEEINKQFEEFVKEQESESFLNNIAIAGKTTFINGIANDKGTLRGEVTCGFMINANSSKEIQENAYDFMKYSLGERMQRYVTYDSTYATAKEEGVPNTYNMPVNKEALKTSYTDIGITEKGVNNITRYSSFMEIYINHCNKLNSFVIKDGYYNKNVIGDIVEDFLQDKISIDNFITNLKSKTEIYLYE